MDIYEQFKKQTHNPGNLDRSQKFLDSKDQGSSYKDLVSGRKYPENVYMIPNLV